MYDKRHIMGLCATFLGLMLAGSAMLAWPAHRETRAVKQQLSDLMGRLDMVDMLALDVEDLATRLQAAERKVTNEIKVIPENPDLAELMRRLSLRVDGETVVDQTFTAGNPFPVLPQDEKSQGGSPVPPELDPAPTAMPLAIDVVGSFDSVFSILRHAESMNRLIRIGTLRIICDRSEKTAHRNEPMVTASIGLEVVYVPSTPSSMR
jgi:hypothetical protein